MSKKRKTREEQMDGAFFPWEKEKTPQDYLDGPDGYRVGQQTKPSGEVVIRLTDGIADKCLPPRFTWSKGHWKSSSSSYKTDAWNTWVVSAEGTPGNYKTRNYVVPEEIGQQATPRHPADWPKDLREPKETKWKTTSSTSTGLPWDLRVRCPGCGHFYKVNDVGDHVKNACPAEQDEPVMWVIGCECHKDDLLAATKVMDGFPIKPPQPKEEPKDEIADELKQAAARKIAPDNVREEALKGD